MDLPILSARKVYADVRVNNQHDKSDQIILTEIMDTIKYDNANMAVKSR